MKHDFSGICKPLHFVTICLCVVAAGLRGAGASAQDRAQGPGTKQDEATGPLVCDQPVYDFGERDNLVKVRHTFHLRNAGDDPVTIERIITTCGCTAAKLDQKTLAPGETVPLKVEASLRGRAGRFEKHIYVLTKGHTQNKMRFTIKGKAVQRIQVEPPVVSLNHAAMDVPVENTTVVQSIEESAKFNITDIGTDSKYLELDFETSEDGMEHRLRVRTKPPLPKGVHQAKVQVFTDNPEFPCLNIPVALRVLDKIEIVPKEVVVYDKGSGLDTTALRFLNVVPGSVQEFTVTGVEVPVESIQPEIIKRDENRYLVKLMKVPVDKALEGKEVVILTDIPGKERVPVPIRIEEYPRPDNKDPSSRGSSE
ncbi:MAG: DUF1573 domain-containing protein [Candidatus Hydrogenedentota bacterium]